MTIELSSDRRIPIGSIAMAILASLLLMACAQAPIDANSKLPPISNSSPNAAFEAQQRDQALGAIARGHFAEAAIAWEILTVLRPDAVYYRERMQLANSRAKSVAAECIQNGNTARARGKIDAAAGWYLQALAADPENASAAESLRAVERERNKRSYLNKSSRITQMRRTMAYGEEPSPSGSIDLNDFEHATLLSRQGDHAEAMRLLERYLVGYSGDEAAHRKLADASCQYADKYSTSASAMDVNAALEKCQRYDPSNVTAKQGLVQLKQSRAADQTPDTGTP